MRLRRSQRQEFAQGGQQSSVAAGFSTQRTGRQALGVDHTLPRAHSSAAKTSLPQQIRLVQPIVANAFHQLPQTPLRVSEVDRCQRAVIDQITGSRSSVLAGRIGEHGCLQLGGQVSESTMQGFAQGEVELQLTRSVRLDEQRPRQWELLRAPAQQLRLIARQPSNQQGLMGAYT